MFIEDVEEHYVAKGPERFVELLANIARLATGPNPAIYVKTGYTEMALLGGAGVKAVTYGPGGEEGTHDANEYVDNPEVVKAVKVFTSLALTVQDETEQLL